MANNSEKFIKNLGYSPKLKNRFTGSNSPTQYASQETQYMADRTRLFVEERAKYATDYVKGLAQGLTDDFLDYTPVNVRLADVSSKNEVRLMRTDDYKVVLFDNINITYFPVGAKLATMGNVFLSVNPSNLSSVNATGIVRRCNASFAYYDYYGNIAYEPIIVERPSLSDNGKDGYKNIELMDGYFNVYCQKNEITSKLGENKRLFIGSKVFSIDGFSDFEEEFSGNYASARIITFTARVTEPNEKDDTVNRIVGGNAQTFGVTLDMPDSVANGNATIVSPTFLKNGEEVLSTEEYPLNWKFSSSDKEIATVDKDGIIEAVGVGTATITATLKENENLTAQATILVTSSAQSKVEFIGVVAANIKQYSTATFTAKLFTGGEQTEEPIAFTFTGASEENYSVEYQSNDSIIVSCNGYDKTPLAITATANGYSTTISVNLEGY